MAFWTETNKRRHWLKGENNKRLKNFPKFLQSEVICWDGEPSFKKFWYLFCFWNTWSTLEKMKKKNPLFFGAFFAFFWNSRNVCHICLRFHWLVSQISLSSIFQRPKNREMWHSEVLRFYAIFTGQERNNRKFASLFESIRCWEFFANNTVPWLRMVDPGPLEGSMKYLHGWSRRSEIEISSREFPNIYVSCRPAKPEGIGQLKIWGRNIFWPLTDSHVSFSPISSIDTL